MSEVVTPANALPAPPSFRWTRALFSLRSIVLALALAFIYLSTPSASQSTPNAVQAFNRLATLDFLIAHYLTAQEQQAILQHPHATQGLSAHSLQPLWQAIQHGDINVPEGAYTPVWQPWFQALLIAGCALFLVYGLQRCSPAGGLWITLALAALMLGVQYYCWSTKAAWLTMGPSITFLFAGFVIMQFWLHPVREITSLRKSRHALALAHAQLLLNSDDTDQAFRTLCLCSKDPACIELAYDIARRQEQRLQQSAAIASYRWIQARHAHFKDIDQRLLALMPQDYSQQYSQLSSQQPSQQSSLQSAPETANIKSTKPILSGLRSKKAKTTPVTLDKTVTLNEPVRPLKLGRYTVERELGRGAMGVVYLGHDPKIARKVAIKTLNVSRFQSAQLGQVKERFFREAEAAGRLSHPGIVAVYDVGEEANLAYIAMDLIQGDSLDHYCRSGQLLSVCEVYHIMLNVAEALDYAHQKNVIHRDIKPSNLIYHAETGAVKVSDFGIARLSDDSLTRTGHVMGSPLYMSPEQLRGKPVTGAADIFSLGTTFYQLLTGALPFTGETLPELTLQILNKKHRSVREVRHDLPSSAVRIINKALHKDPHKRFESASAMADQLRKALQKDFRENVA